MGEDIPRIRKQPLGSESLLVVRGWGDGAAAIHADACRFRERFSKWGRYGLSAFAIAEAAELSALMEWRLERFAVVRVFGGKHWKRSG